MHIFTTPFGRRPLTAAQRQAQTVAAGCPREMAVHKWTVFRHVAAARLRLGLADRAVAVLNALLSFHPDTALVAGDDAALVVFPSNAQLGLRAHGMAEATLRRHLGALVEAGLVIRRDSPNGKRFARKGQGGRIAVAYGFDLTPLVARAAELAALAAAVEAEAASLRRLRERVTLLRRDAAKMLAAVAEEAPARAAFVERYRTAIALLPRQVTHDALATAEAALASLGADLTNLLTERVESPRMGADVAGNERHRQDSESEDPESEATGRTRAPVPGPGRDAAYSLDRVIEACPDLTAYARGGIRSWGEFLAAAEFVRPMLGIGPEIWREARATLGDEAAAVTVAAILQRGEGIRNPGGYLRALVERRRTGRYSLGPVLQALRRAKLAATPLPARAPGSI